MSGLLDVAGEGDGRDFGGEGDSEIDVTGDFQAIAVADQATEGITCVVIGEVIGYALRMTQF